MHARMPLIAVLSLFVLLCAPPAQADDATKEQLARELMALTGAGDIGKQVAEGMLAQFSDNPSIPAGFVEKLVEAMKPDELVDMVVPLYVNAYDEATLRAAVEFYRSPAGRAFTAKTPQITQESIAVGQKWGIEVAQRAMAELEKEQRSGK